MTMQDLGFPQRNQLWRGAILATIAHAMWITSYPEMAYELSWDGPYYTRQDGQNTRGTIAFVRGGLLGLFHDRTSPRIQWHAAEPPSLSARLAGLPNRLVELIQPTALHLQASSYSVGEPIITSAFWSDNGQTSATEAWPDVLTHGAHLVRVETMPMEAALYEWQVQYEWSEAAMNVLSGLFERRTALPGSPVMLDEDEYEQLVANGRNGLAEARELFAAIGILLPKRWRRDQ